MKYSIVQKYCKQNSANFVLCTPDFLSAISHEISQKFVQNVSLPNDISSEISRKRRSLFRKFTQAKFCASTNKLMSNKMKQIKYEKVTEM